MIPLELKKDKDGLLYLVDNTIFNRSYLEIDKRHDIDEYYQNYFYSINSTDEYIIKHSCTEFTRKQIEKIKKMLSILIEKQKDVKSVDFPIAYFVYTKKLCGLIIKYYKDGISCDNVIKLRDIEYLGKYYSHDADNIHNLFMLFNDILSIIEELLDNSIYYTDINPGNIVLHDNKVKLIDFDYRFVHFQENNLRYKIVMSGYDYLIKEILRCYNLEYNVDSLNNIDEAKKYLKTIENNVRKRGAI